jgi:hypothetical protein
MLTSLEYKCVNKTNTLSPSPKGFQSPKFSDSDFREVRGPRTRTRTSEKLCMQCTLSNCGPIPGTFPFAKIQIAIIISKLLGRFAAVGSYPA